MPYNYTRTLYTKLQNLRQGTKSVNDYAGIFLLMAWTVLTETEEQRVSHFIGGLRSQIQSTLLQFDPFSVLKAHQCAILIEQHSHNQTSSWNSQRTRFSSSTETRLINSLEHSKISESA